MPAPAQISGYTRVKSAYNDTALGSYLRQLDISLFKRIAFFQIQQSYIPVFFSSAHMPQRFLPGLSNNNYIIIHTYLSPFIKKYYFEIFSRMIFSFNFFCELPEIFSCRNGFVKHFSKDLLSLHYVYLIRLC